MMSGASLSAVSREVSDQFSLVRDPDISVIMLVHNHAKYLRKSIESVLEQSSRFSFEIVIGEDASSDESLQIALQYQRARPDCVRVISSHHNLGAHKNYYRLLKAARGRYISHLDGDDYWLPGKIDLQASHLEENPSCAAVYSNALTVDEAGSVLGLFNNIDNLSFDLPYLLRGGNFLCTSTMMFRSELSTVLSEQEKIMIDYEVHLTAAQRGSLFQFAVPLAAYRVNSSTSMLSFASRGVRTLYWQAIESVPRDLLSDEDKAKSAADFCRRILFRSFREQDPTLLSEWLPRVMRASPYGTLRTSLLTAHAMVMQIGLAVRTWVCRAVEANHSVRLHRRARHW
jgi:glycosyltransferase involved in cell wall biosynthesis